MMKCIKCEEGELKKIKFIKTGQFANVCDYCETFWMDDETIKQNTGHALHPYHPGDDYVYEVQEFDELDEDQKPVRNVRII